MCPPVGALIERLIVINRGLFRNLVKDLRCAEADDVELFTGGYPALVPFGHCRAVPFAYTTAYRDFSNTYYLGPDPNLNRIIGDDFLIRHHIRVQSRAIISCTGSQ